MCDIKLIVAAPRRELDCFLASVRGLRSALVIDGLVPDEEDAVYFQRCNNNRCEFIFHAKANPVLEWARSVVEASPELKMRLKYRLDDGQQKESLFYGNNVNTNTVVFP